jgi:hypothetical protein
MLKDKPPALSAKDDIYFFISFSFSPIFKSLKSTKPRYNKESVNVLTLIHKQENKNQNKKHVVTRQLDKTFAVK